MTCCVFCQRGEIRKTLLIISKSHFIVHKNAFALLNQGRAKKLPKNCVHTAPSWSKPSEPHNHLYSEEGGKGQSSLMLIKNKALQPWLAKGMVTC